MNALTQSNLDDIDSRLLCKDAFYKAVSRPSSPTRAFHVNNGLHRAPQGEQKTWSRTRILAYGRALLRFRTSIEFRNHLF
jgi:hypothetical protein